MSLYSDSINFEKLIASLHQATLNAEGFENISVQHNVTIPCRSGATAQFDIYWKFKQAGVIHEVAIECKNYNSTVSVGKVREFADKLRDAGNVRGIMVSRKGFQDGAKKVAKDSGIMLKKYQFPDEMDWTGKVRAVVVTMHMYILDNVRHAFDWDTEWWQEHYPDQKSFSSERMVSTEEILFVKEDGTRIKSFHELENELPRGSESAKDLKHLFTFEEPTFLRSPNVPDLKINRVAFLYDVHEVTEKLTSKADDVIHGLLIDDETGELILHYLDNSVRTVRNDVS